MKAKKSKKALLVGIAGSNNAFCLSLYNLKAYACSDERIKEQWDLKVIQHALINPAGNEDISRNKKINNLAQQIISAKPDLVAFSCYMWNVEVFKELAHMVRREWSQTKIVWGGPEMTTDYILKGIYDDLEADFFVSGEGELTFLELLQNQIDEEPALSQIRGLSFRDDSQATFKVNEKRIPFKSLKEIPSPFLENLVDEDVLLRKGVEVNLETQRGCTFRCSYCVYHKDMSQIAYNIVGRVIEEVVYVCTRGVKRLRFVDANFSSDLDHAKAVMRALIEKKIEAKIMFEIIPGFIDEELAALFGEYNDLHSWNELTLGVGVQTINYEVLKEMRRGIKIDRFERTFDLFEKHNIYAKIDLIIGLPGEDIQSIERTLEYFLDRLRNSHAHLLCCHVMRGLPGTELLEMAQEEYKMKFSSKCEPHELIESPILPRVDMLQCLRRTAVIFRLVNHEGWVKREFITGKASGGESIRDLFFSTRDVLAVSNIQLIDMMIKRLMPYLSKRNSNFAKADFPYAETWWWVWSRVEISNDWITQCLDSFIEDAGITVKR